MAENVKVCEIDASLKEKLKKFRFRKEKNNAAIVMKVEKETQMVILDEDYEDYSLEELSEELPSAQPRFIVYSYVYDHGDGRTSYPLVFIFISPQGCKPEQQMMYAGSMKSVVEETGVTKVYDLRSTEDLTEEWLKEKLKFFH